MTMFSNGTSFSRYQSSSICADDSRSHGVCNDENNYEYIFYTDVNGDGNKHRDFLNHLHKYC
jgi:hypothetical protein